MNWEDIIKRKRKRYPTTAQKKNKNWNNLDDEERFQLRMKRDIKANRTMRDKEQEKLRTCPKCGFKDNLFGSSAKFCAKCGTKMGGSK